MASGGNPSEGKAGRPIKLETCFMAINPADSQKCANELAGKKPFVVVSTLNFFGNQFPIYQQAGITVIVGTPITVADFTLRACTRSVPAVAASASTPALVYAATQDAEGQAASPCRGPTRLLVWSATTTSRRSRSTCCKGTVPGTLRRWPARSRTSTHDRRPDQARPPRT